MTYDKKVLRKARARFEADRDRRRAQFQTQREDIFRRQPRLRDVDAQLRSTSKQIVSAILRRETDPMQAILKLRSENLRQQEEKKRLLRELRLPETYLDETPACTRCNDRGYSDGRMCPCLRAYYVQEQSKELSRLLDLDGQSFDTFSFEWYSDQRDHPDMPSERENIKLVYDICREFVRDFGTRPQNLLLFGPSGLGKTFLSAAIAREVIAKGYSVVYDTASHIFEQFEAQKFSHDEDAAEETGHVLACDLLIVDDLGTEMQSQFVTSTLYRIISVRLMEKRSTVFNTNLAPTRFSIYYSDQVASRLTGEFSILPFQGTDIRQQKKAQGQKETEQRKETQEQKEAKQRKEIGNRPGRDPLQQSDAPSVSLFVPGCKPDSDFTPHPDSFSPPQV